MWSCAGVLEVDEPGYTWIKEGTCMRACDITIALNACLFVPRYGIYPEQWKITATPPEIEEEEEEEGSRKKTRDKSKRKKPRRRSSTSRGKKDQGKIKIMDPPQAVASLPAEDDPQEEGIGKVPRTPDLDDVEASALVPSNLSVQLTEDDRTDPALLEISPPAETSSPSPSLDDRGKMKRSSSEPEDPAIGEGFEEISSKDKDPSAGKVPRERTSFLAPPPEADLPFLTIEEPEPSEELPPLSSSTRLRTTLIELFSDFQQGSGVSEDGEIHLTPWLPCPQICNISTFGSNIRVPSTSPLLLLYLCFQCRKGLLLVDQNPLELRFLEARALIPVNLPSRSVLAPRNQPIAKETTSLSSTPGHPALSHAILSKKVISCPQRVFFYFDWFKVTELGIMNALKDSKMSL